MKIFAERLKMLRTDKVLSMQALSRALKVSSSSVFAWESGLLDIKGSQLILLSKVFSVSIDCLMELED